MAPTIFAQTALPYYSTDSQNRRCCLQQDDRTSLKHATQRHSDGLPLLVVSGRTPLPVACLFDEARADRVQVHVVEFLQGFLLGVQVERTILRLPTHARRSALLAGDPTSGDVDSTKTLRIGREARRRKSVAWPWGHYAIGRRATQSACCCATPTIFRMNQLKWHSLLRKNHRGYPLPARFSCAVKPIGAQAGAWAPGKPYLSLGSWMRRFSSSLTSRTQMLR